MVTQDHIISGVHSEIVFEEVTIYFTVCLVLDEPRRSRTPGGACAAARVVSAPPARDASPAPPPVVRHARVSFDRFPK